jgi:hypothetical protein
MRDTPPQPSERAAAAASPAPLQMAGRRSGEGSASVLEHLVQERLRSSDKNAPGRKQRT